MTSPFADFGLRPTLVQALDGLDYQEPTPVQSAVIPIMLEGHDVIAQARTGTGKTAAFALPALQNLQGRGEVEVLVLSPTRELAMQVGNAFEAYSKHEKARTLTIYGGSSYAIQKRGLREGVEIVVGTPGRLLDLVAQGLLQLGKVRLLVLDEADEMLSMGFAEELEQLVAELPKERQTALFSATMPPEMKKLAAHATQKAQHVNLSKELSLQSTTLACYVVRQNDKVAAITRIFEVEEVHSALVFCRTRGQTAVLAAELASRGIPAEALSGDLNQIAREKVLDRFRNETFRVLVATDVAARGLDIDHLSHVVNLDLPQNPETFVHRIGRTGRAGRTGVALTLITPKEEWKLKRIERALKRPIERRKVPSRKEIMQVRLGTLFGQLDKWLGSKRCHKELAWVEELVAAGHKPKEIAAAALKLASASAKQSPIAEMTEEDPVLKSDKPLQKKKKKGKRAGKTVQLVASAGKKHQLKPREVFETLVEVAGIPKAAIGDIRISKTRSFVDVDPEVVAQVLKQNGKYRAGRYNFVFKVD